MKVALIGDVHANLPALEAVLADARRRRLRTVWNVGDYVGYGAFPDAVVARLRQVEAAAVIGNYDQKVLKFPARRAKWRRKKAPAKFLAFQWAYEHLSAASRRYLQSLPEQARFDAAGRRVLVVHGSPVSTKELLTAETPTGRLAELARQARADVVCCGHSHQSFCRRVDGVWFINPGSVGRPEGGDPRACYAVVTLGPRGTVGVEPIRVAYDVARAAAAIRDSGLPEAFAQMVLQGHDLDGVVQGPADPGRRPDADEDDVLSAVLELAGQCHYEQEHSSQVTKLALRLFDELGPLHGLGPAERHWLRWAGLLHDIGWVSGQQGHHKAALRTILGARSLPLKRRVRGIVASVARYHRKALPSESHAHFAALSGPDRRTVRLLAALLRVADGLDRTHMRVVDDLRCVIASEKVTVRCRATGPADAELHAAGKKGDLFQLVFGRVLEFEASPSAPRRRTRAATRAGPRAS